VTKPIAGQVRAGFVKGLSFELDNFQLAALDALDRQENVLVSAPTGSGKTVVAEYAVARALAEGFRIFYTTPLKALSNQKYRDLARAYGSSRVGLLTGDNSINGNAPVVVMTTEVLRNMLYAGSDSLELLRYVVLDEVHYLQDTYRGPVWEEVVIHCAPQVRLVCLSATVSNAAELSDWISTVRGPTATIVETHRPVELKNLYLMGDRRSGDLKLLPVLVKGRPNPQIAERTGEQPSRGGDRSRSPGTPAGRGRLFVPKRPAVIELLAERHMLPAIYFIFSRAACDDAVAACRREDWRLTNEEERQAIRGIAQEKVSLLSSDDLEALDYQRWLEGLEAGFASHHAGLVPPFKEAVEAAFSQGLLKAVFATETLSLGINMPARSVVIEKLTKFTGEHHESVTPGEYTQLTGRAGRRGIDEIGYAVVLWSAYTPFEQVAELAASRSSVLTSSFRPTYNMAANLVGRYRPETAHHLLNLSFAQYRADADVVRLVAQVERTAAALRQARSTLPAGGQDGSARVGPKARPNRASRRQSAPRSGTRAAAEQVARLERELDRLDRRIQARGESLARQFDRVLEVLEGWGYVDGWALTAKGQALSRVYHEVDLLITETLARGHLDGLSPPDLAALMSVFTFEARSKEIEPASFPTAELGRRWRSIEGVAGQLNAQEQRAGVTPTRQVEPGLMNLARQWAGGADLAEIVAGASIPAGDFVRNIKQLVDLLRQLGDIAARQATADTARRAAKDLFRGVVAASSVVGADVTIPHPGSGET
jgi:ATP-dependent RNA helicase HelY